MSYQQKAPPNRAVLRSMCCQLSGRSRATLDRARRFGEQRIRDEAGQQTVLSETLQTASTTPVESAGCERRGMEPFGTAAIWLHNDGFWVPGLIATFATRWNAGLLPHRQFSDSAFIARLG